MKKSIFLCALGLVTFISALHAQVIKLGHVSTAELLQQLPDVKKSDSTLAAYQKSLEDQYNIMTDEYKKKLEQFNNDAAKMTDPVKEVRANEIRDLEKRIQEFQQNAQEKMGAKKQEVLAPILKKVEDAIKAVGKENGYTYILDSSPGGSVIYSMESNDIILLVKKKLGLK